MSSYQPKKIVVPRFEESQGFYTNPERSRLMSRIRAKDTEPEIKLRKFLWGLGIRYRKNVKKLPGNPDIVVSKYKLVVFIDGEFWHGYNWGEKRDRIKSNRGFWVPKIERNIQRDQINNKILEEQGWTVFRFWANQIKSEFPICVNRILDYIEQFENSNDGNLVKL